MKRLSSLIIQTVAVLSSRLIRQTRLALSIIACLLVVCAGHSSFAQEGQPREEPDAPSSATRTGKITGRVVADDGKPLADAAIYIFKMYARLPAPSQNAQTDDE